MALITMMLCGIFSISSHASNLCQHESSYQNKAAVTETQYDTISTSKIYFRHDKAAIDSNYLENRTSLISIRKALQEIASESPHSIASIIIEGYSSPVGNEPYNQRLSLRRAQKAEAFLRTIPGLKDLNMILVGKGEDWDTFTKDINADYHKENRRLVLTILDLNIPTYQKEIQLKALDHGQATWSYLVRNHMTASRHAVTVVVVKNRFAGEILPKLDTITTGAVTMLQSTINTADLFKPAPSSKTPLVSKTPLASVRTNLLVPALNVGAELPLGNNWSVAADYYFPWIWPSKKNENCFEFLGWSAEGRYWFGRNRKPQDRLKGHSVGVYFAGGYYDFERSYRGMQGEFISPGVDYTYSMAIGRRKNLHLQFTLALGYIRSWGRTYNVFGSYGDLYPDEGTLVWDYIGPTKAAVTLVVPFYKKEGRK